MQAVRRETFVLAGNDPLALVRAVARMCAMLGITSFRLVVELAEVRVRGASPTRTARRVRSWASELCAALGARIDVRGELPDQGVLVVSNHRSYIDIGLIAAQVPVAFLARQSMRSWPLLGLAAEKGNTIFVKRDDRASRSAAREAVRDMLGRGVSFVVFPEGTTSVPPTLLAFRPGIFRMAAEGGFRVVPVAIEYEDPEDAWAGANKSFTGHFLRTFGKPSMNASVTFGPAMSGEDAQELQERAREWIRQAVGAPD